MWYQTSITLPAYSRGCHLITSSLLKTLSSPLSSVEIGLLHLFIHHTSASLTINENADPDVRADLSTILDRIVPESSSAAGGGGGGGKALYRHTDEGPDDMPAHAKAALMDSSVTIPITKGRLNLGTWQGIYLNEHRNSGGRRTIIATINGQRSKKEKTEQKASNNAGDESDDDEEE